MDGFRLYSTIGIEGFVSPPPGPLPPVYLLSPSSTEDSKESALELPFVSSEIIGVMKETPGDFVVRELLPKDCGKISKFISHYNNTAGKTTKQEADMITSNSDEVRIANLPSFPPMCLPSDETGRKRAKIESNDKEIESEKQEGTLPPSTETREPGGKLTSSEFFLDETIDNYLKKVASDQDQSMELRKSIDTLNEMANNRLLNLDGVEGVPNMLEATENQGKQRTEVWIPPLIPPLATDLNGVELDTDADVRAQRKSFHRAIRIKFPFLKTESSSQSPKNNDTSGQEEMAKSDRKDHNGEKKKHDDHWIKVSVETCFDELIEYLDSPKEDLRKLFLFRNRGFEGTQLNSNKVVKGTDNETSATLRLRPNVSKDDRRKVHHLLAAKNRHFETSIRQAKDEKQNESECVDGIPKNTTDLVVSWKKQSLLKGRRNNKRKHSDDTEGNFKRNNLLCVLKKTQKEHLTTIQSLSKNLRCRQSDIGFAGIKDMQAITYQFITLRNMTQKFAERGINRLHGRRKSDIEVKILCSNVDFVLNVGDLEGNQFEITVRNIKRVRVDPHAVVAKDDNALLVKESFVDCDKDHVNQMVSRVRESGFINFYGEQRIGTPGIAKDVGVRPFEIGQAMLRHDFMGAINLLMEGTRHQETKDVQRVRQAWRDSNGNPSITLKAFQGANIMPRERTVLRGLNKYPENPLEALRFLTYNMRIFYINAYQSFIFNRAASERMKLFGSTVVKGDLYFEKDGDNRENVKVVTGNEEPRVEMKQVVLPLPGYNVSYPENEIGDFYTHLLESDGVKFDKRDIPEATANGSYRKLLVYPVNLKVHIDDLGEQSCKSMKLSFGLPKGSYATMLLRELMLTTVARQRD